jgi:hypothetical protein
MSDKTTQTFLLVKADENDADYVTQETVIPDNKEGLETLALVQKVSDLIRERSVNQPHLYNWGHFRGGETRESVYPTLTEEELDIFSDLVPHGQEGVHTIEKIELRHVTILGRFLG